MTLLQELRVSRGNPASEGSLGALFADFSTLALESHASYAFRKETRETEIRGRRGGSISLGSRMDRLEPVILYSWAGLSFLSVSRDRLLELVPALSSARRERCSIDPARLSIDYLPRRISRMKKKKKGGGLICLVREKVEGEKDSLSFPFRLIDRVLLSIIDLVPNPLRSPNNREIIRILEPSVSLKFGSAAIFIYVWFFDSLGKYYFQCFSVLWAWDTIMKLEIELIRSAE